jgi:hypothetical protein
MSVPVLGGALEGVRGGRRISRRVLLSAATLWLG